MNTFQSVVVYGNASHSEIMRRFMETSPRPTILKAKHMPGSKKMPKRDPDAPPAPKAEKNASRSRWRIDFVGTKPNLVGLEA